MCTAFLRCACRLCCKTCALTLNQASRHGQEGLPTAAFRIAASPTGTHRRPRHFRRSRMRRSRCPSCSVLRCRSSRRRRAGSSRAGTLRQRVATTAVPRSSAARTTTSTAAGCSTASGRPTTAPTQVGKAADVHRRGNFVDGIGMHLRAAVQAFAALVPLRSSHSERPSCRPPHAAGIAAAARRRLLRRAQSAAGGACIPPPRRGALL